MKRPNWHVLNVRYGFAHDRVPLEVKQEFFGLGAAGCGLQVGLDWDDRMTLLRFVQLLRNVEAISK